MFFVFLMLHCSRCKGLQSVWSVLVQHTQRGGVQMRLFEMCPEPSLALTVLELLPV